MKKASVPNSLSNAVRTLAMVRVVGLEPTRLAAQEPKSCVSTNSTIPANVSVRTSCRYFIALCFYTAREPRRSVTLDPHL